MSASTNNAAGSKGRRAVDSCRDEFTLVVEAGKPKMQCNHCGVTITNHTATLKNHLARKHGGGGGDAGASGNGDVKASIVAGLGTTEEDDGEGEGDVVEEQVVDKRRVDKVNGKQIGATAAVALSPVVEQPAAIDVKKEAKKRSHCSSIDKGSQLNGDKEREDAVQSQPDEVGAQEGAADKKRKLADAANDDDDTVANGVVKPEVLPLIDHQEFADMNRGTLSSVGGCNAVGCAYEC